MIPFHYILARTHGGQKYCVAASFSDDYGPIRVQLNMLLDGPHGAQFREAHAEILACINGEESNYEFPDPSELNRQRKERLLAEAKRVKEAAERAGKVFEKAHGDVHAAAEQLASLSAEQRQLLAAEGDPGESKPASVAREIQLATAREQAQIAQEQAPIQAAAQQAVETGTQSVNEAASGPQLDLGETPKKRK